MLMRDPNNPVSPSVPAPSPGELTDEAWARVSQISKDATALELLLKTDWSEPSAPVLVRAPFDVVAGDIEFDGPSTFAQGSIQVTTKEPTAKAVVTRWDASTGAKISQEMEGIKRGTVLDNKGTVEMIVPHNKVVKTQEGFVFRSGATVVDMRGGEPLEGDGSDDPRKSAGRMMVLHIDGHIQILNNLDDMFRYRMYTFADEKENAEKQPASGGMGGYGGEGGGGYDP